MHDFKTFLFGAGSSLGGLLVSLTTHIPELQAISLVVGIALGVASLAKILLGFFDKK